MCTSSIKYQYSLLHQKQTFIVKELARFWFGLWWLSVLLVEETVVLRENHRPVASH